MSNNIYRQIFDRIAQGNSVFLLTKLQKTQGKSGVDCVKALGFTDVRGLFSIEKSMNRNTFVWENTSGNTIIEPFSPQERLIVLGGGHIAIPLVEFATKIGFQVIVVDDRISFANTKRFPLAKKVICDSFENAIKNLHIHKSDYVVIITRGHRYDSLCLKAICNMQEPTYIGMIGSKKRTAIVKKQLEADGCSKELLNRVHTPIGLAIGAITPEEIAISILAELIQHKRLVKTQKDSYIFSDVDYEVLGKLANETAISKAIVTVIETKGSVPRGVGAKMLVYSDKTVVGSIGGGCSEAFVVNEAKDIIGTNTYKIMDIDLTGDAAEEGMVCGGIMKVLIEDYQAAF
jgi:xanthine dehydrogenase accessory factor